jgi:hypothetical protein
MVGLIAIFGIVGRLLRTLLQDDPVRRLLSWAHMGQDISVQNVGGVITQSAFTTVVPRFEYQCGVVLA